MITKEMYNKLSKEKQEELSKRIIEVRKNTTLMEYSFQMIRLFSFFIVLVVFWIYKKNILGNIFLLN